MRIFGIFLLVVAFSLPSAVSAAGLIPCGGPNELECQACHLVQLGDRIIDFLVSISAALGAIMFAIAGLKMATSGGNQSAVSSAKETMTNVVIGFIILLAAWLIVDTVMKAFVDTSKFQKAGFGVWNQIQCKKLPVYSEGSDEEDDAVGADQCHDGVDNDSDGKIDANDPECAFGNKYEDGRKEQCSDGVDNDGDGKIDADDIGCHTDGSVNSSSYDPNLDNESANNTTGGGQFTLSSSLNTAQSGHKSSTLSSFITCVADKIPSGTYYITSISDNKIAGGTYTFAYCAANGQAGGCAHSANSCHYGGKSCVGSSYAIDVRINGVSASQQQSILSAADQCGGWGQYESDHIHISKGSSCGCY